MDMTITPLRERLVKVSLVGRLDAAGVDRIETRFLANLVPEANSAIVDLSGVEFIASLGIRMLISTARNLKARHAQLVVFGAQEGVNEVFETVSLGQMVTICPTEAEALAAIIPSPV